MSLYRRLVPAVTVILGVFVIVAVARSTAQDRPQLKRPEEAPQERPVEAKKTKKEKGPRAVGLLQVSGGKATLIPIAILIDGKFYDASVYKADPVPMALEGGTVYEAEQTGESQGLFTIKGALHSKNPGSMSPWLGTGPYVLNGTEVAKTTHKAEDKPVGLDDSNDEPPRLTRGKEASPAPSSNGSSGTGSSEKAGTAAPPTSPQPASGSTAGGASGQEAPKPASAPSTDQGGKEQGGTRQGSPAQSSSGQSSQGSTSQAQASQSDGSQSKESGNYYRPMLRRGKPTDSAVQDAEEETEPKVEKTVSAATGSSTPPPVAAQFVPAISDAGGPDPQSYKFFWKEGEEDERRQQMLALAANEVRAYVTAREKGAIPAKPPALKTGAAKAGASAHKSVAKPAQPVFENIQFRAFDLWKNSQPVMILTAEAHLPAPAGATAAPEVYSVSIAAKTDIYGNLRKLYSGVTDKFHLDVTPRLELIDVVDADGDGRGELLFRETTDAGSGYVIYRATADKLWKMFDSLSEE